VLAVDGGDRRLPRQHDLERQGQLLLLGQAQRAADRDAVELAGGAVFAAAALDLDPGDQPQGDVLDLDVVAAADHVDVPGEGAAGTPVRVGQHSVDARPADAEGTQHLLEAHELPLPRTDRWGRS
jgi:hypothetical protein